MICVKEEYIIPFVLKFICFLICMSKNNYTQLTYLYFFKLYMHVWLYNLYSCSANKQTELKDPKWKQGERDRISVNGMSNTFLEHLTGPNFRPPSILLPTLETAVLDKQDRSPPTVKWFSSFSTVGC